MFKLQSKGVICGAVLAAVGIATPVVAQDRTALVIANSAYAGDAALPRVRDAGVKVSETLLGLGFAVNRLENPSAADLQIAVDTAQSGDGVSLIYYVGRTTVEDNISLLVPVSGAGGVAIEPMVSGASDSMRFVFLDMCHDAVDVDIAEDDGPDDDDFLEGEGDDPDEDLPLSDALVISIESAENLFFGASVEPGEECNFTAGETLTDVLLDRLTVPGLAADQFVPALQDQPEGAESISDAIWFGTTLQEQFVFRTATSDVRLTAEDYAMLDQLSPSARDQMLRLWASAGIAVDIEGADAVAATPIAPVATTTNSTVVLVAPVRPVAAATVISPISPRASSGAGTSIQPVTSGVTLVAGGAAAPAPAVFRATPGENGLPAPSILVGFATDDDVTVAPEVEDGPVAGSGLSYDDLDARNAMREQDAELFASLVESGAFDPPEAELARAIQTELARMNCYRSGIDGIWGPGSRRSVTAYYEEVGGSTPSQDPDPRIFRQIIANDDVRCPTPAPAPQAAAAPRRQTTTQAAPRRTTAAPQRQAAPAPAPAAPAPAARRTISQSAGTGAFR